MTHWFNKTSVKLLTGADFDDNKPWNLRDKRCAFVLFFADWCGHCQDLKPEYIKFSDAAQFIKVYAIDIEAQKTLLQKLNGNTNSPVKIDGFPTIWMYGNGKPVGQYEGPRTWQKMLDAAMKLCKSNCKCSETV